MAEVGPFISKENEATVLDAIKAKLALKADKTAVESSLAGKADAVHTHVCTDITDLETKLNQYAKKSDISTVYKYKGSCTWAELIAKTDAAVGDTYNVTDKDGMNYACITAATAGEANWDALGIITNVDLSGYYTITQIQSNYYDKTTSDGRFAAKTHTHQIADVSGLQGALDGKAASTHTHTHSSITDFSDGVNSVLSANNIRACTSEEIQALIAGLDA